MNEFKLHCPILFTSFNSKIGLEEDFKGRFRQLIDVLSQQVEDSVVFRTLLMIIAAIFVCTHKKAFAFPT